MSSEITTMNVEDLEAIVREVIGLRKVRIDPQLGAEQVPGWDSLQHTIIILEINARFGTELEAERTLEFKTLGELIEAVNASRT